MQKLARLITRSRRRPRPHSGIAPAALGPGGAAGADSGAMPAPQIGVRSARPAGSAESTGEVDDHLVEIPPRLHGGEAVAHRLRERSGIGGVGGQVEVDPDPGDSPTPAARRVGIGLGFIWVMGDNRSNSSDSRYHQGDAHGGFVPIDDVIGVAKQIVWPLSRWGGLSGGHEAFTAVPDPA